MPSHDVRIHQLFLSHDTSKMSSSCLFVSFMLDNWFSLLSVTLPARKPLPKFNRVRGIPRGQFSDAKQHLRIYEGQKHHRSGLYHSLFDTIPICSSAYYALAQPV